MSLKIEGLEDVLEYFSNMEDAEGLETAMKRACELVEGEAKKKAPKGSGELRRSIESNVENKEGDIIGTIFSPLIYAPYVEYGTGLFAENEGRQDVPWHYQDEKGEWHSTSGMAPRPYLRPALNENREQIARILQGGLIDD